MQLPTGVGLDYETAARIRRGILAEAEHDGNSPVVVAVLGKCRLNQTGPDRYKVLDFGAMHGVLPASYLWAPGKARCAQELQCDTLQLPKKGWSEFDLTLVTIMDPLQCVWGGGLQIMRSNGEVVGSVGVSGRDSGQADHDLVVAAWPNIEWPT